MDKKIIIKDQYPDIPNNPSEFMEYWKNKIGLIPAKFRNKATIEIEAEDDYGEPHFRIEMIYFRPETESEAKARMELEKYNNLRREQAEKKEYNRLKEKYQ